MAVFSFLSFSLGQSKEVAIISLERMMSRLKNQEEGIVSMFRAQREVSRKRKGVVIFLYPELSQTLRFHKFLCPGGKKHSKRSAVKEAQEDRCGHDPNIPTCRHCWDRVRVSALPWRGQECA